MRVALGADHAGVDLKDALKPVLDAMGVTTEDFGTRDAAAVDYPDFAAAVARAVSEGRVDRGILVCGSGIGMAITANKVPGIRAAAIDDTTAARLSREHNDLNVLALGARTTALPEATAIVRAFLETGFEGGRHAARVRKIHETERATFPFNLDIERASTIPARLYTDPVVLEIEQSRVFGRTWQLAGHAANLGEPGHYFTAEVAGESVVIVRDGETVRGFHNVCLHRAGPVATGCGQRQTLQCKYHGWTYRLDGSLLRTPGMDQARNFAADDMHLVPVQVAVWGPLVFVNLDAKAPPLSHVLEDLPERVGFDPAVAYACVQRREYRVACNWKVYVDNYLEGYHIPLVHPTLHKELDDKQYRVEPKRYYSIQHAPLRGTSAGDADRLYRPDAANDAAQYYWLFPNMMLNIYFGQLQTNVVIPRGVDETAVVFEWFALDQSVDPEGDDWARRVAFSDKVQDEDREICEVVQRNLRSRVYDRGRYAPRLEQGVHHFHGLLHEFLS